MEDFFVRYCNVCNDTKDNIKNLGMNEQESNFYKGYLAIWDKPNEKKCPCCNKGFPINTNLTNKEFDIIAKVSNLDRHFLEAMIKLKEDNIIEFQSRMSQFKTQLEQQESSKAQNENTPRCPNCGSTNIQIVQRKWSLLTGFLTNKTDRVCVNCKNKF